MEMVSPRAGRGEPLADTRNTSTTHFEGPQRPAHDRDIPQQRDGYDVHGDHAQRHGLCLIHGQAARGESMSGGDEGDVWGGGEDALGDEGARGGGEGQRSHDFILRDAFGESVRAWEGGTERK